MPVGRLAVKRSLVHFDLTSRPRLASPLIERASKRERGGGVRSLESSLSVFALESPHPKADALSKRFSAASAAQCGGEFIFSFPRRRSLPQSVQNAQFASQPFTSNPRLIICRWTEIALLRRFSIGFLDIALPAHSQHRQSHFAQPRIRGHQHHTDHPTRISRVYLVKLSIRQLFLFHSLPP